MKIQYFLIPLIFSPAYAHAVELKKEVESYEVTMYAFDTCSKDGLAAGKLSYGADPTLDLASLAYLYIEPPCRNRGIASKLITTVLKDIKEQCPNIKYVRFMAMPTKDSKMSLDALIEFYKKRGAIVTSQNPHWAEMQFNYDE